MNLHSTLFGTINNTTKTLKPSSRSSSFFIDKESYGVDLVAALNEASSSTLKAHSGSLFMAHARSVY